MHDDSISITKDGGKDKVPFSGSIVGVGGVVHAQPAVQSWIMK